MKELRHQIIICQRQIALTRNDQMIQEREIQQCGCILDLLGDLKVCIAGREVPGGVIMCLM